ncbi:MAG: DUF4105 domain-containing protein [Bacteroidales bacterium]|nr:DUF4105 domain-containing protein [Bacteroidales bacterium]
MKKFLSLLILACCAWANLHAQLAFSDSVEISLLTGEPGIQSFERFGHTAIRVRDMRKGHLDVVFHYGVYNYHEPYFILHFIEGICNYTMGALYMSDFEEEYQNRGLGMTEQILDLDSLQSQLFLNALLENYKPQNRHYRYNFFFDNCATRPFDLLNRHVSVGTETASHITYDTTWIEPVTLRQMLQQKTGTGNWLEFGIALALAGRADQRASFREQMFLPDHLQEAYRHATLDGHPLVKENRRITDYRTDITDALNDKGIFALQPFNVAFVLLLAAIALSSWESKRKYQLGSNYSTSLSTRLFDSFWLLASGLSGCIIWFLNFFSEHPAVDNNINCVWLLPTNLLFIIPIWIKNAKKIRRIYFFVIFALAIIYLVTACFADQYCHPAFVLLCALMIVRSVSSIKLEG